MKNRLISGLIVLLVLSLTGTALSHSTKGRIKIPLDKKTLEIDDIAYFVESYVHRELYKGKFEKAEKRFYVNKFHNIKQDGNTAVINFRTLDNKTREKFDDQMAIHRLDNGVWAYKNGQEPREMYTYVLKTGYYYKKYVLPVSAAGIVIAIAFLAVYRTMKRRKPSVQKPARSDTVNP
ncbi:MAG: hypothetical protein MI862_22585 [Desulfobacterales bacterium]|nr:hypothetical protein [Desulfobacterales bacterium]